MCENVKRFITDAFHALTGIVVDAFRASIGVIVVFVISVVCMKCCIFLALQERESQLVAVCVPIIEKMIWPLVVLVLVFYLKENIVQILIEVPGLIKRSYLPYSPLPTAESGKNLMPITTKTEAATDSEPKDHPEEVERILDVLGTEYGVPVVPRVRVLNHEWRADGFFVFAEKQFFVAVLPYTLRERAKNVVSRMEMILRDSEAANAVFVLFVYGQEDDSFLRMLRKECGERIVLRCAK